MIKCDVLCKLDLALEFVAFLPASLGPLRISSVTSRTPGVLREVVHQMLDGSGAVAQFKQEFVRR